MLQKYPIKEERDTYKAYLKFNRNSTHALNQYRQSFGLIMYRKSDIENIHMIPASVYNDVHAIVVKIGIMSVENVYNPPKAFMPGSFTSLISHISLRRRI